MSLFSGSQVTTGAGTLTLGGNVILTASGTNSASISGKLDLGSASPTFTVNDGAAAVDLDVSAAISGAVVGLTKLGAGTLRFSGATANTYNGTTSVEDGILQLAKVSGVDAFRGGLIVGTLTGSAAVVLVASNQIPDLIAVTVRPSGTFNLNGQSDTIGNLFTLTPGGSVALGSGTLTVGANNTPALYEGSISGGGNLVKVGTGTLTLGGSAPNTYTGATTVNAGTLLVATFDQIPDASAVTVNSPGSLQLSGSNENIMALSGNGSVLLGSNILGVGANNGSSTFSGVISGSGGLAKIGTGTLLLTGNNGFTGGTGVNGGTLLVNGSQPASAVLLNASGGTLGGTGTVGAITGSSGMLAPGSSAGIPTVNGNVQLFSATTFAVELNGTTAGSGYDQLTASGTVTLTNPTLNVVVPPTFAPPFGHVFTVLNKTSSVQSPAPSTACPRATSSPSPTASSASATSTAPAATTSRSPSSRRSASA